MRLDRTRASALLRLLAWDAPFLPVVTGARADGEALVLDLEAPGEPLAAGARWPRPAQAGLAAQLIAASAFIYERAWLPSRGLLGCARVSLDGGAPRLVLGALPRVALDDPGLTRHLLGRPRLAETLAVAAVLPLLERVLPVIGWRAAAAAVPAWQAPAALLAAALGAARAGAALAHPGGCGRFLWARRWAAAGSGQHRVEEAEALRRVAGVARLASALEERELEIACGPLDEAELARVAARASAGGRDALLLTSMPATGARILGLHDGAGAVWVLAPPGVDALCHAEAAAIRGAARPLLAGELLGEAARAAFARPPAAPESDLAGFASPAARSALAWLNAAPLGLTTAELARLEVGQAVLDELERLRLASRHGGRWHAAQASPVSRESLVRLSERLGPESVSSLLAGALSGGDRGPLVAWCERRLEEGDPEAALSATRLVPGLELCAAEAALALGRLTEAEALLAAVGPARRDDVWRVLRAWRASQAGQRPEAAAALEGVDLDALPARLASCAECRLADLAREPAERRSHLLAAVRRWPADESEASVALAVLDGRTRRRAWSRLLGRRFAGDLAARTLQLLALDAMARGCHAAAMTALRAALRHASGRNPRLLGELHSDLGSAALYLDRSVVAERHLLLAERLLAQCGSAAAVTVVQANRGVLACDRLRWREAIELVEAARRARGPVEDSMHWLEEVEIVRAWLAAGDLGRARAGLENLEQVAGSDPRLADPLAWLRAYLALAEGDLAAVERQASDVEQAERPLLLALVEADRGREPEATLSTRWGLLHASRALAAWRRGEKALALERASTAVERGGPEGALGAARFLLLAARDRPLPAAAGELADRAAAALDQADLAAWSERLRTGLGLAPLRVVRALDGIVNAGTDAFSAPRLAQLVHALGIEGIEVRRQGMEPASAGSRTGEAVERSFGPATVLGWGAVDAAARATLELLARLAAHLTAAPGAPEAGHGSLLGRSHAMDAVREQIARFGPLPFPVLIEGEPGTGKELVARELHRASGRSGEFVPLNCAGIPAALLEGELFGAARGAYTGADRERPGLVEAAERGTLFLDEIGEMPLELQGKLLRLLQEREVRRLGATRARTVDVRFLAATNQDLAAMVASGRFRQDLYYRVAVAVIQTPPLRERPEDVEELAVRLLADFGSRFGRPGLRLAPEALRALAAARWTGNVRELQSMIQCAVALSRPGELLGPDRFPGLATAPASAAPTPYEQAVEAFRRSYFTALLASCGNNRSEAARRAGISRQTLLYHLKQLGI